MSTRPDLRIVVTGADGFIGRNLCVRLGEAGWTGVVPVTRATPPDALAAALGSAEFVFHLAGVNRPKEEAEFERGNADLTRALCRALSATGRKVPVAFTSSTQAERDNPYGRSKRSAEEALREYGGATGAPVHLFRLPNVFGKWSRPNYNSAVATFCHNLSRGLPISVNDPAAPLTLVHVDDVVEAFLGLLPAPGVTPPAGGARTVDPVYATTVGAVADLLRGIAAGRPALQVPETGQGLVRALYSTYISFVPPGDFKYAVKRHVDPRGAFVEFLRTPGAGQVSYFTAGPGIMRGSHYHHTKTEKFLVVQGRARFGFRSLATGERYEIVTGAAEAEVVDTAPGWVHDVTNVGADELIVLVWANEQFDPARPDTVPAKVSA